MSWRNQSSKIKIFGLFSGILLHGPKKKANPKAGF
jgi:hypothetical protein